MKLAFIGLGKMGAAIASNLLRAGHDLRVYNRTRDKTEALGSRGAFVASSPAEAAAEAEMIFTMLADDAALEQVVLGPDGFASTLAKNAVHISLSTISTALSRKLAREHSDRGQGFVAAPVFGRPDFAESKKLLVVTSGEPAAVERCRPLLDAIGRRTIVLGSEPWQANAMKLCGNFMILSMLEAFGESNAVVRKFGVNPEDYLEILSEVFGSPLYKNYGSNVIQRKFEPAGFTLKLGFKDVRFVLAAAQEMNVAMPIASVVRDQCLNGLAHGQAELDWSSIALVPARNAGLKEGIDRAGAPGE